MRVIATLLGKRLVQAILVALLVSSLCFFMVRLLPGDLAYEIAGGRYGHELTSQEAEAVRAELGLNQPAFQAWLTWMSHLLRGDLGHSYSQGTSVWTLIHDQLGVTLRLSGAAFVLSLLIGPPIGLIAGLRPGGLVDRAGLSISVLLRSMPPFVIGILLILVFSVSLHLLPVAGQSTPGAIFLPALTLALGMAAVSSRIVRSAMIDVAKSEYFHFPLTKGLPLPRVVLRHAVRNVSVPVVTHLGMQLLYLLEGVIVVETLFAWPGIGHALSHAVRERDIPMIQGTVLVMALMFVAFNAVVDLILVAVDPRLRQQ